MNIFISIVLCFYHMKNRKIHLFTNDFQIHVFVNVVCNYSFCHSGYKRTVFLRRVYLNGLSGHFYFRTLYHISDTCDGIYPSVLAVCASTGLLNLGKLWNRSYMRMALFGNLCASCKRDSVIPFEYQIL